MEQITQEQYIKQALIQLPISERLVCLAIRRLQQKMKQLEQEQSKEISKTHLQFFEQFKNIENKANKIIQGNPIQQKDLTGTENLFNPTQKSDKQKYMKSGQKIQDYWRTVFINCSIAPQLSEQDLQLLRFCQQISTKISDDALEISFTFGENTFIKAGTVTRAVKLQGPQPVSYGGGKVQWLQQSSGFFELIFKQTLQNQHLLFAFNYVATLINEIIPYSLEYYFGLVQGQQEEQVDQEQQQQQQGNQDAEA